MAENESNTAVEEPPFSFRVEDVGPGSKKVSVEIPKETITKRIADQYKELRQGAAIPGFRKGHAPQKLIEKKFAADVKEQVRQNLIRDSYQEAIEKNSLQVLGEPEFENAEAIKLADDAPLSYTFSVEIQPEVNLPELTGLKVKKPKITVTDEHINQAMNNLREQQGTLVPVEGRGVEADDHIRANIHIRVDGNVVSHQHDARLIVKPGRIGGLQVDDLPQQLAGTNPGDTKNVMVKVPDDSPAENLRGKEVQIEIEVIDIKKLELVELNQEFLDSLGFQNEQELRDALREQMLERINWDIAQAMRRQAADQLLGKVEIALPAKLSDRQTQRVVSRRATDLLMRGVPREKIEASVQHLQSGAAEEAARELKLFFILQKVAEQKEVDVSEMELNGRIALMAMQRGERPEKVKQELLKDGQTLSNLYVQMREEKTLDKILESAEIEEVEATAAEQKAATEGESSAT